MNVLAISGSFRHGSYNRSLLEAAARSAPPGMRVEIFESVASIPHYSQDLEESADGVPRSVRELRRRVKESDALLIATPEYNHSFPGVLKNALDWLSRPPDEVLAGKPVAVIGASGGPWGTRLAQSALRQVLYATESVVLPAPTLFVRHADKVFDADGRLVDLRVETQLRQVLAAFAAWIRRTPMSWPIVHRFQASLIPVNAYAVEFRDHVVVVDGTLGVSDGRALRERVNATGKPLAAVVVTHAHPDHYGGLTALVDGLDDVPIVATQGVSDVIRRDDEAKEQILRPMFGDEWAARRLFPTRVVRDGEQLTFDGGSLRVMDLGPGESPHDSVWLLESGGAAQAFVGDVVYNRMHAYLADGFHEGWLVNIDRVRAALPARTTFYPGHGDPGPAHELLDWQEGYIRTFVDAVRAAATGRPSSDEAVNGLVNARMKAYLPSEDLLFLMQLSIAPALARSGAEAA